MSAYSMGLRERIVLACGAGQLRVLHNDKRAIFTAAAKAQHAATFAHDLQPQPRGELEPDEEPSCARRAVGNSLTL